MKKVIYLLVISVLLMMSVTGCKDSGKDKSEGDKTVSEAAASEEKNQQKDEDNSKTDTEEEKTEESETPDVQTVADALLDQGDFNDKLAAVDKTMALTRLYALEENIVDGCAFYTNTNATAEEIAVIKVKDSKDADIVKAAYNKRIEDQKAACKDYLPDEMPKLDAAVIYTNGNYIILCVSNDSGKIEDSLKNMFE